MSGRLRYTPNCPSAVCFVPVHFSLRKIIPKQAGVVYLVASSKHHTNGCNRKGNETVRKKILSRSQRGTFFNYLSVLITNKFFKQINHSASEKATPSSHVVSSRSHAQSLLQANLIFHLSQHDPGQMKPALSSAHSKKRIALSHRANQ